MDMQVKNTTFGALGVTRRADRQEQRDNKAVENRTEVASKDASSAIVSAGMALVSKPMAKLSDTDKSFVESLNKKYVENDPKQKAKPAMDKLLSGSSEDVASRLQSLRDVQSQDSTISPMDFVSAQSDLKNLESRELDGLVGKTQTEQLTKLSQARHLLGASYPVDFAVEMVNLDETFQTYQNDLGMKEGVEKASREVSVSDNIKASRFGIRTSQDVKSLAGLSAQAYTPVDKIKPERLGDYEIISSSTDENGFAGVAFKDKTGNIVIAYRGSDDVNDIKSDLEMINGTKLPEQFYNAEQFYEDVKAQNPNSKIVLTGHSLGGALSQLVAAHNEDSFAVAFNAPGTKDIIEHESGLSDTGNIYNVLVDGDKISGTLAQPGQVQLIDAKTDKYGNKLHPHAIGNCM